MDKNHYSKNENQNEEIKPILDDSFKISQKNNEKKWTIVGLVLGVIFGVFGFIYLFIDTEKTGVMFVFIYSCVLLVLGILFFIFRGKNFSIYFFFTGLGIIVVLLYVFIFGYSNINIKPKYTSFSEGACYNSQNWSSWQTETKNVRQIMTQTISTDRNMNTSTATATLVLTIDLSSPTAFIPSKTPTYTPTMSPTPFFGYLFCIKDSYQWAIPINEYPKSGTEIGAIAPNECVRFDGVTLDEKWFRLVLDQDNLIIYPYANSRYGWVTSEGLSDKEINRNALPVVETPSSPN